MSWWSEITGKAEALLDKMDQAAATSLQGTGLVTPPRKPLPPAPSLVYEPTTQPPSFPGTESSALQPLTQSSSTGYKSLGKPKTSSIFGRESPTEQPQTTSSLFSAHRRSVPSDETLFEFLNTPSKDNRQPARARRAPPRATPIKAHHPLSPVKMQPLVGSGESEEQQQQQVEVAAWEEPSPGREPQLEEKEPAGDHPDAPSPSSSATDKDTEAKEDSDISVGVAEAKMPDHEDPVGSVPSDQSERVALQQKVSNLELENKLLKREVASLNDELGAVMGRVREVGESVAHYESEIGSLREQATRADHMIRQLRSHEEDLQATLEARDSQIQVLRAQLEQADKKVEEFKLQVTNSVKEKDRLLQDVNLSSDANHHALESLKAQLQQSEAQLQRKGESMAAMKVEFAERESRLQLEQHQLSEALAVQQRQLALQQAKSGEFQTALHSAHNELRLLRKEHEEYKQRAAGILQVKERLIASLQSGEGGPGAAQEAKLEELRLEKEHLQIQLRTIQQHMESLRAEIQEQEDHHGEQVEQLLAQVREAEGALEEERRLLTATQAEFSQLSHEVEELRDQEASERATLAAQLKNKEAELESLKAKLATSSSVSPGRAELESRLHELTESLIQKQTVLETLSSEKSSLNVQLQRLKSQLVEAQKIHPHRTQTVVNGLEDGESDSTRIRPMASVLSSVEDTPASSHLHNVRRAINTVDRVSIRLGVFLRRYPYARLFALAYMVLLHMWVMVVLLTYTPEVHDTHVPL